MAVLELDSPQPLTQHLDELRTRIIITLLVFLAGFFVSLRYVDPVLNWMARPVGEFIYTSPGEALFVKIKIAAGMSVLATFPLILYQVWRYIEVALKPRERPFVRTIVPISSALFFVGMAIAFFGVAPAAMHFLMKFSSPTLRPLISIEAYLEFIFWMAIGFGVLFQLPLVVVGLCYAGVLSVKTLRKYRRHVIVGIVTVAAFLTPGPDVFSQLLLSVPSYLLFEVSLIIAARVERPRRIANS